LPPLVENKVKKAEPAFDLSSTEKEFTKNIALMLNNTFKKFAKSIIAGKDVDFKPIDDAAFKWAQQHSMELVTQINQTTMNDLQYALARGLEANEDIGDIAKRIRDVFDRADKYRSFLIARTETTNAANLGTIAAYKQVGIKTKQWLTGQDERVCPLCGPLDGKIVGIDDEFEPGIFAPSRHPNCRCTVISGTEL